MSNERCETNRGHGMKQRYATLEGLEALHPGSSRGWPEAVQSRTVSLTAAFEGVRSHRLMACSAGLRFRPPAVSSIYDEYFFANIIFPTNTKELENLGMAPHL